MKNNKTFRLVNPHEKESICKLLFLGYSEVDTALIKKIADYRCEVWHTSKKITSTEDFDIVVSYGYRHILSKDIIKNSRAPLINLHISYLPWNRGAHPNFWSFYESTPCGVSIHLIDEGIDTGPIIYQKKVAFDTKINTFSETYTQLKQEIEKLFLKNINNIINKTYSPKTQNGYGSFHTRLTCPKIFKDGTQISKMKFQD